MPHSFSNKYAYGRFLKVTDNYVPCGMWRSIFLTTVMKSILLGSNLTPELTGRGHKAITDKLTMKGKLIRAPVQ
jgi:hypothetical protein